MSLLLDWFGFVEGATSDIRGSITLVGFSPDFLSFPALPTEANVSLVLVVKDDDEPAPLVIEGKEAQISLEVRGPDGSVISGLQQVINIGTRRFSDVPAVIQIILPVRLKINRYGEYVASVTFTIDEHRVVAERSVRIISG